MSSLDRVSATASFAAQIRALPDEGVLAPDKAHAFLADLTAQAGRPKGDPVRLQAVIRVSGRPCDMYLADEITLPAFAPLIQDLLNIAEHVPGVDP